MKQITIKSITLTNFKGIKSLLIDFNPETTRIFGENETGKTTLVDAFTWCLFGKDSQGRSDSNFNIKTLDKNNKVIPKIDHEVQVDLDVQGEEVVLKRTYRESWVKKKGREESEFSGHKTTYHWNEVPLKKSEYENKIRNIIDESIFKLITDPHAFTSLHWEAQRKLLIDISGDVSDLDVLSNNKDFSILFNTPKTIKELKAEWDAKRKKINDELKLIPTRIDEVSRGLPEVEPGHFDALEKEHHAIEIEIAKNEKMIRDASQHGEEEQKAIEGISTKIRDLDIKKEDIVSKIRIQMLDKRNQAMTDYLEVANEHTELVSLIDQKNSDLPRLNSDVNRADRELADTAPRLNDLREKYDEISKEKFEVTAEYLSCPACDRPYDKKEADSKKEKLIAQYNKRKAEHLKGINIEGKNLKERVDKSKELKEVTILAINLIEEEIKTLKNKSPKLAERAKLLKDAYESFNSDIDEQKSIAENKDIADIEASKKTLQEALNNRPKVDISHWEKVIGECRLQLEEITQELAIKDVLETRKQRIKELEKSEKTMASQMAMLEKDLFLVDEFIAAKTEMVQSKVNAKFNLVNFKMFEIQINGGLSPTCKAIFKGVDIADVNNAGQIQAGIDIIDTLCDHYQVYCPIWIDNAESITTIPETKSQQIHLIVSEDHEKLTVL